MRVSFPLKVQAAAYTIGDSVGGKLKISGLLRSPTVGGYLSSVVMLDRANQAKSYDMFLYNRDLTATVNDKAAFNQLPADDDASLGVFNLGTINLRGTGSGMFFVSGLKIPLFLPQADVWAVIVARSAPTFATVDDVTLIFSAEDRLG